MHYRNREYEKALDAYRSALSAAVGLSKFTDPELQFYTAEMHETLNKTTEAIDAYLKIPYVYPAAKDLALKAYLRVGRIFEDREDWQNARVVYEKVIAYGTDEAKFARERIEWIDANAAPHNQ